MSCRTNVVGMTHDEESSTRLMHHYSKGTTNLGCRLSGLMEKKRTMNGHRLHSAEHDDTSKQLQSTTQFTLLLPVEEHINRDKCASSPPLPPPSLLPSLSILSRCAPPPSSASHFPCKFYTKTAAPVLPTARRKEGGRKTTHHGKD